MATSPVDTPFPCGDRCANDPSFGRRFDVDRPSIGFHQPRVRTAM